MHEQAERGEPLKNHPRYEKVKSLNHGSYGFVQLARNRQTGELVAIKFMERGNKITKNVEREIINHSNLLHPHIIQFKEAFLTDAYLAIAMEYAAGGDMFQLVKQRRGLPEHEARWFFQQLIIGLDYCHRMGVINRDIKLENTLLDTSRRQLLKICDFGYSKAMKDSLPKTKVGTPGYTAPEIILNSRHYDGALVDVWSAGVMLYVRLFCPVGSPWISLKVMLFCQYPFERANDEEDQGTFQKVLQRIIKVDYHLPTDVPVSHECRDMLSHILVADASKRLSIADIQRHPWFMRDLPPGLAEFNATCLRQQRARGGLHNAHAISHIIREAKRAAGRVAVLPPDGFEDDADLHDFMTDEADEGATFCAQTR